MMMVVVTVGIVGLSMEQNKMALYIQCKMANMSFDKLGFIILLSNAFGGNSYFILCYLLPPLVAMLIVLC